MRARREHSPIVSPARRSRDSAFEVDAPSSRSSTKQSEKYNDLMNYLDGITRNAASAHGGGHVVPADKSMSTISASPAPAAATSSGGASRRRFVWDEEDGDLGPGSVSVYGSVVEKNVTYFSDPSATDVAPDTASAGSDIESKVHDIADKIKSMKVELREKNELAKLLQNDYARVKAARERQAKKLKDVAEKKIGDAQLEQKEAFRQQQTLVDRIQKDVRALEEKEAKLNAKLVKLRDEWDASVECARAAVRRNRRRDIQQWEADELHSLSKFVAARADAMHKSAAQHMAPELEKVVVEGRDALTKREAEGDKARRQLAESLRMDGDKKFTEFQQLCRERYSGSDDACRARLVAETRIQEAMSRLSGERNALKDRFQRDKRLAAEEFEGRKKVINDSLNEMTHSIQEMHLQKMRDVLSSHNREVSMLSQQLITDREHLAEELEKERDSYIQSQRDRISRLETAARETMALEIERAAESGLANIIEKLREEVQRERRQTKDHWDNELISLREMYDKRVRDTETRAHGALSMSSKLRSEIDVLRIEDMENRRQLEGEKRNSARASEQLQLLKQRSQHYGFDGTDSIFSKTSSKHGQTRAPFHCSEGSKEEDGVFRNLSPNSRNRSLRTERSDHYETLIAEKENEEMNWTRQALECGEKLNSSQREHLKHIKDIEDQNNDEISRIRDKIDVVTRRKQATLTGLQDELRDMQIANGDVQKLIDSKRDCNFFAGNRTAHSSDK